MFTGIIEATGKIKSIEKWGSNKRLCIESSLANELKIDQSVSHNGVCLTVTKVLSDSYLVECVDETLLKSNLGLLKKGDILNLERGMPANGRIDGHFVLGHVDQTAISLSALDAKGSWLFGFQYDVATGNITVPKGSVCVNGVSLTVIDSKPGYFSVAIIPHTYERTNFNTLMPGSMANIEFDIIGKYVAQMLKHNN